MLRWNTFSHHHSTNKRLCVGEKKNRNKREREIDDEIVADGRAYLPRANTIKVFSFSLLLLPHTHTQKLSRKTICFIFHSCSLSPFPLHLSLTFSLIDDVDSSSLRMRDVRSCCILCRSLSFVFMICIWVNVSNFVLCIYIYVLSSVDDDHDYDDEISPPENIKGRRKKKIDILPW
jgi:hypothetical protein